MWYFKYSYDTSAAKARVGVISIMLDNIPAWYETMPQSDYDVPHSLRLYIDTMSDTRHLKYPRTPCE